jgi:hypothetical protein
LCGFIARRQAERQTTEDVLTPLAQMWHSKQTCVGKRG